MTLILAITAIWLGIIGLVVAFVARAGRVLNGRRRAA